LLLAGSDFRAPDFAIIRSIAPPHPLIEKIVDVDKKVATPQAGSDASNKMFEQRL
jgi:hypothetical protein